MSDLSAFPITRQYPARDPGILQLYSTPTPNGVKVSILLEELGLAYEPHFVDITRNQTWTDDYLSLNPNGKIPAILDPHGPDGNPLVLWESGAILVYLAEKAGRLIPSDPAARYETLQWVFWQMAALGPMTGQMGFFHKFAGKDWEDKRPRDRFVAEVKRLLGVLDGRLADRPFIMGDDFTIADIALIGWVRAIPAFYAAGDLVGWEALKAVPEWVARCEARPAVARGLTLPAKPAA